MPSATHKQTYAINVMIATEARVTNPVSKPNPTHQSEAMAPSPDSESSFLRPIRYTKAGLIMFNVFSYALHTSIKKMGGKVIITFTMVIPNDTYGPRSGSDLERISLL